MNVQAKVAQSTTTTSEAVVVDALPLSPDEQRELLYLMRDLHSALGPVLALGAALGDPAAREEMLNSLPPMVRMMANTVLR